MISIQSIKTGAAGAISRLSRAVTVHIVPKFGSNLRLALALPRLSGTVRFESYSGPGMCSTNTTFSMVSVYPFLAFASRDVGFSPRVLPWLSRWIECQMDGYDIIFSRLSCCYI